MHRITHAIPHALTLGNLLCGSAAIGAVAMGAPPAHAVLWIILGLVCDLLDGRAARRLGTSGPFGAQLDSLADLVTFGVAPAVALYAWRLHEAGLLGLIGCAAIVAAAATRLARFTVASGGPKPAGPARFSGLSVTIPAAVILGAIAADLAIPPMGVAGGALVLAALMVSSVPYRSFKDRSLGVIAIPCAVIIVASIAWRGDWVTGLGTAFAFGGLAFAGASPVVGLGRRIKALR
ncbi:MAG: CDP-diacylglycerol--serine O-phosphatidyltransferase [Bradymonadia bacterium]|jgi:CDP-diacylglycerol--serine O-phosphatidyltransferase